ncbi:host attachment protein [Sinirhodobacter huangdaonensis]|uniref:Host attachment protein n=1 Tax=Paenirhodobacter huangdaonensis TaxID=2501515 RepID=A0A443LX83_9RHOB|nr:host attachment protein [Sinirhodobacter huangdaonensis]RWR53848.1 host attachment protein [Sinirhodobacter huangdaonensis]
MLLSKGMRVLVSDETRALLLENAGDTKTPELRLVAECRAAPEVEFADKPGREGDRATGHGTAFEQGDPERVGQERFARDLVAFLGTHAGAARLVLVAPPRMLAALRAVLPEALAAGVVAELDKTLTGQPLPEVAQVLAAALDPV